VEVRGGTVVRQWQPKVAGKEEGLGQAGRRKEEDKGSTSSRARHIALQGGNAAQQTKMKFVITPTYYIQ
jgi:hypothetical protein